MPSSNPNNPRRCSMQLFGFFVSFFLLSYICLSELVLHESTMLQLTEAPFTPTFVAIEGALLIMLLITAPIYLHPASFWVRPILVFLLLFTGLNLMFYLTGWASNVFKAFLDSPTPAALLLFVGISMQIALITACFELFLILRNRSMRTALARWTARFLKDVLHELDQQARQSPGSVSSD